MKYLDRNKVEIKPFECVTYDHMYSQRTEDVARKYYARSIYQIFEFSGTPQAPHSVYFSGKHMVSENIDDWDIGSFNLTDEDVKILDFEIEGPCVQCPLYLKCVLNQEPRINR